MPARMYCDASDIASLGGHSIRAARYLMNMFEREKKVTYNGKKKLVDIRYLASYLASLDGSDPAQKRADILEIIHHKSAKN